MGRCAGSKRVLRVLAVVSFVMLAYGALVLAPTWAYAVDAGEDAGLAVVSDGRKDERVEAALAPDATTPEAEASGKVSASDGDDKSEDEAAGADEVIHYLDERGEDATIALSACTHANDCVRDGAFQFTSGWYYVTGWCHQLGRGDVTGDVHIILCDGGTLEQYKGIHVGRNSTLSIYCQEGRRGKLIAGWAHEEGCAGIGGNKGEDCGKIYIYGGNIEANGGEDGAGIGGGAGGSCVRFEMFDGVVTAKALSYTPFYLGIDDKCSKMMVPGGGAGVGGGVGKSGGYVFVHGGKLTATGGTYMDINGGAGIGGGAEATGGAIEIDGGEVNATGGVGAAGIGSAFTRSCGPISISHCKVTATGGRAAAGIGGGERGYCSHIQITDSEVDATGLGGAGIGGGNNAKGGEVVISGGSIKATSKDPDGASGVSAMQSAAIGAGCCGGGGVVSIEDNARVSCSVQNGDRHADCIGKGEGTDLAEAEIRLYDGASVSSSGNRVLASDRTKALVQDTEICIEPCPHEQSECTKSPAGHTRRCPHCSAFAEDKVFDHEFGDDDRCRQCGYERPHPRFVDATLPTDGSLGIVFWLEARDYGAFDYQGDTVELSVGGKCARTLSCKVDDGRRDGAGLYGFVMPLSSLEMAEEVMVRFSCGDRECAEMTTSMSELLAAHIEGRRGDPVTRLAAITVANFGTYMQLWSSREKGWTLGRDYAAMELAFPAYCNVSDASVKLGGYACESDAHRKDGTAADARDGVDHVTASARFESRVSLDVTVTPQFADIESARCFCEKGSDCQVTGELLKDGRYRAHLEHICPRDFDKPLTITFEHGGTTYTVRASLFSYLHAMLKDKGVSQDAKRAMAAVYWFYTQAGGIERMGR